MSTQKTLKLFDIQVCKQLEHYSKLEFWSVQVWQTNPEHMKDQDLLWEGSTAFEPSTDTEGYQPNGSTLEELVSEATKVIRGEQK